MGISRYRTVQLVSNARPEYSELFRKRGITDMLHYSFDKFKELKIRDIPDVMLNKHVWTPSDRFHKLAHTYYNDATYWWIIALFNGKPLETDVTIGDTLIIPTPLGSILAALEV